MGQTIDSVVLTEVGRYQHPYVLFPDSFSAPTMSSRIDRLDRPFVYMACRDSGLFTLDISTPSLPVVVNRKYPAFFGGLKVMNLEQVDALLYLALGDIGNGVESPALAIMDVSDPATPILLHQYTHTAFTHGSAIVKVKGDFAYLGCMEEGILVLDVSDPSNITFLSSFLPPEPTWPDVANYPSNARGMDFDGDVLYLAFDAGALRAIDISDPANLQQIGRYFNPQHPAFTNPAYNNVLVIGERLYATIDYCGFEVIDISDPAEMVQVDWLNPWNCFGLSWFGSDGHMNEMVSTLGDSLLFVSAGDSEVLVYDITAPDAPALIGGHILPNDSASTWGVDVHDGTVVGSYINNHGLPFQPYDSKYGGVVIFDWEVTFGTAVEALRTSNMRPRILGNPSSGLVHIQLPPTGEKSIHINVVDIQGRFVRDARIVAEGTVQQLFKLDLTGQADGTYFITVSTPYDRTTLRAVLAGN
jgi:hypothetical protein